MPSLQALFDRLRLKETDSSSSSSMRDQKQMITKYYLPPSTSSPSYPTTSLQPISTPPHLPPLPSSTLILSLSHPPPSTSKATQYFLDCIPDPPAYLLHASTLIQKFLTPQQAEQRETKWRHQLIELKLVDEEGLAWTSEGRVHVSLKWVDRIRIEEENGGKKRDEAVKEFKGVCEYLWWTSSLSQLVLMHTFFFCAFFT
jgi:hypothetical protein